METIKSIKKKVTYNAPVLALIKGKAIPVTGREGP
jgi:hypothetical protein